MVRLARMKGAGPVSAHELAQAEGLSSDYAEQLLAKLRTAGLVRSVRGARGGAMLDCEPARVNIADVIAAMDEPTCLIPCLEEECDRAACCVTRGVWQRANEALKDIFSAATIEKLADEARHLESGDALTFEI